MLRCKAPPLGLVLRGGLLARLLSAPEGRLGLGRALPEPLALGLALGELGPRGVELPGEALRLGPGSSLGLLPPPLRLVGRPSAARELLLEASEALPEGLALLPLLLEGAVPPRERPLHLPPGVVELGGQPFRPPPLLLQPRAGVLELRGEGCRCLLPAARGLPELRRAAPLPRQLAHEAVHLGLPSGVGLPELPLPVLPLLPHEPPLRLRLRLEPRLAVGGAPLQRLDLRLEVVLDLEPLSDHLVVFPVALGDGLLELAPRTGELVPKRLAVRRRGPRDLRRASR
mmetsp:Transcript_18309/g.43791  ORF Transcript_18309/g.43791 Transcript_18309/m.43791 type:complete len:286 (+) Transcript_18309:436-1293(+)